MGAVECQAVVRWKCKTRSRKEQVTRLAMSTVRLQPWEGIERDTLMVRTNVHMVCRRYLRIIPRHDDHQQSACRYEATILLFSSYRRTRYLALAAPIPAPQRY